MKKSILFLMAVVFSINVFSQYKTYKKNVFVKFAEIENNNGTLITKKDSIEFSFMPDNENLWGINIRNLSTQKIYILWNSAAIGTGDDVKKLIFGTDSKLTMRMEKQKELIYPNSSSDKKIDNADNFEYQNIIAPLYSIKIMKIRGDWPIKIIIPIEKNGTKTDYIFKFIVYIEK